MTKNKTNFISLYPRSDTELAAWPDGWLGLILLFLPLPSISRDSRLKLSWLLWSLYIGNGK